MVLKSLSSTTDCDIRPSIANVHPDLCTYSGSDTDTDFLRTSITSNTNLHTFTLMDRDLRSFCMGSSIFVVPDQNTRTSSAGDNAYHNLDLFRAIANDTDIRSSVANDTYIRNDNAGDNEERHLDLCTSVANDTDMRISVAKDEEHEDSANDYKIREDIADHNPVFYTVANESNFRTFALMDFDLHSSIATDTDICTSDAPDRNICTSVAKFRDTRTSSAGDNADHNPDLFSSIANDTDIRTYMADRIHLCTSVATIDTDPTNTELRNSALKNTSKSLSLTIETRTSVAADCDLRTYFSDSFPGMYATTLNSESFQPPHICTDTTSDNLNFCTSIANDTDMRTSVATFPDLRNSIGGDANELPRGQAAIFSLERRAKPVKINFAWNLNLRTSVASAQNICHTRTSVAKLPPFSSVVTNTDIRKTFRADISDHDRTSLASDIAYRTAVRTSTAEDTNPCTSALPDCDARTYIAEDNADLEVYNTFQSVPIATADADLRISVPNHDNPGHCCQS